jgi:hypothetical protein
VERIVGAGVDVHGQAEVAGLVGAAEAAGPSADNVAGHSTHTGIYYEEATEVVGYTFPSHNRSEQVP